MVILTLSRKNLLFDRTLGILTWNGVGQWFTLEDRDRGLHALMLPQAIEQIKKKDETAIPYGFYEVVLSESARFKRVMPEILRVPGFEGIRIHAGNTPLDTSGCLILGKMMNGNDLAYSKSAVEEFEAKLTEALKTERVFLSVTK